MCCLQGAKNIVKLEVTTSLLISAVSGAGAAIIGGAIGVPLLFRQRKVWEATM
jgi:hypothetical protein